MCRMLERVMKFKCCWISRPTKIGHPILSVVLLHCKDPQDAQDIRCPVETGMDRFRNISVTAWPNFQNGVAPFDSFFLGGGGLWFAVAYTKNSRQSGTPCFGMTTRFRLDGFGALAGAKDKKFSLFHIRPHQPWGLGPTRAPVQWVLGIFPGD
jgi:hypothetical protein